MKHLRGVPMLVLCGLLGCMHQQTRLQSADENEHDPVADVKTIGDVTSVANAEPIVVSGVGLVVGLNGTGGAAPPGSYRSVLEHDLQSQGVENVQEVLNSPNAALVLISAVIPAGARKGDPLDVEVVLPPQSKATSLRSGYLRQCTLYNYESTHNLVPTTTRPDQLVKGHPLAHAEGSLLVGFGDGDEASQLKRGRIWGGGKSAIDRPFYLALNRDQEFVRIAIRVATRVNETFQGPYRGPGSDLAEAKDKQIVTLRVPAQYKLNLPRYLRVIRLIPLQEAPAASSAYRKRLETNLLQPDKTITAALRLEALGTDSIPALKAGLQSEHALVRFAAAEALAYLGSPACGDELAKLAKDQPALRAFCLTALASLDEAICHVKLREMLSSESTEARYGAFRALRALDERDPGIHGELLNESFWLHRVAPAATPLVHFSTSRRAEIVLFGEEVLFDPPFSFRAGPDFIVSAGRDDDHCMVTSITLKNGRRYKQCSLKLSDVLRALADLGGQYPDAVELLRQADQIRCLNCRVVADALPEAISVFQLADEGRRHEPGKPRKDTDDSANLIQTDDDILAARADLCAIPTLFEDGSRRRPSHHADQDGGGGGQ
jgi:flagellar basal body P-ring protein FlgI